MESSQWNNPKRKGNPVEKLRIKEVVVVEGRYDKIKLSSILDAVIIVTDGFGIFKDRDKQELIRSYADSVGILSCTDSDGAGLVIRGFLSGLVPPDQIRHILIPPIPGKERRKPTPSKEGTLGVEGVDARILRELFRPFAIPTPSDAPTRSDALAFSDDPTPPRRAGRTPAEPESNPVTRGDLYEDGLMGGPHASARRLLLMEQLRLPRNLSVTALIDAINLRGGRRAYLWAMENMEKAEKITPSEENGPPPNTNRNT